MGTRNKTALIIGIRSQDGYFLCHLLNKKGYNVIGTCHHLEDDDPLADFEQLDKIKILNLDLLDSSSVESCLRRVKDVHNGLLEIYCLASVSQVSQSIARPVDSANANALGPLRVLKVLVDLGMTSSVRFLFASSSEMFGNPATHPQNESTPCVPTGPYGMSKLFATQQVRFCRDFYNMFACSAILYNHESLRRPSKFVTRKVTLSASAIAKGLITHLEIGNLNAKRDWGHAEDFVHAMWMMLQQDTPQDFIVSTGVLHSVRDLVSSSFSHAGIELIWEGDGLEEVGIDRGTGKIRVKVNPAFYRPEEKLWNEITRVSDVVNVVGDNSKLRNLGWTPSYSFHEIVASMMAHDLSLSADAILALLGSK